MTRQLDIEQLLDIWLDEGPTDTADTVFDAAVARIYSQRQRPAWRIQPLRFPTMSTPIKLVAVSAALLIVLVGGAVFFGGGSTRQAPGPTPTPTPSPTPSASPSEAPSAGARFPAWYPPTSDGGAGILPAGSQTTRQFIAGTTFTVPEGWVNEADNTQIYTLFPDTPANEAEYARSRETAQNVVLVRNIANNMFAFCEETGYFPGGTAAEIIDFVATNPALSATEPVEVTVDGRSGLQVDVQLNPEWTGSCPPNPDHPTRDYLDARNRVIVLDDTLGRTIGIAVGSNYSADFEALLADAMPIIQSLDFPGPGASPSP